MSATPQTIKKGRGRVTAVIVVVVIAVLLSIWFAKGTTFEKPVLIATTQSFPDSIRYSNGAWYWIEPSPKAGGRLVRGTPGSATSVGKAETISSYDILDNKIVWTARQGKRWSVVVAQPDGSSAKDLWSGDEEPMGVRLVSGRAYWIHRLPAPATDSGPMPPLSPVLEVVSAPLEGGAPTPVSQLPESEDGVVLGSHGGTLYVVAYRRSLPGSLAIYQIAQDGKPVRVVGVGLGPTPLLTSDGTLYWLAPSQEVAQPIESYVLQRLDKDGKPETLCDWLPPRGTLYETKSGILYSDNSAPSTLWYTGDKDALPTSIKLPVGYAGIAASGDSILTGYYQSGKIVPTLYQTHLP